jgi:hypothetical protein
MDGDWTARALCKGTPLSLWFPSRGNSDAARKAAAYCHVCPVQAECRADADDSDRTCGVWAGRFYREGANYAVPPVVKTGPSPSELATLRRRETYTAWLELLDRGISSVDATRELAARHKVNYTTVYAWIKKARAENVKRATALAGAGPT